MDFLFLLKSIEQREFHPNNFPPPHHLAEKASHDEPQNPVEIKKGDEEENKDEKVDEEHYYGTDEIFGFSLNSQFIWKESNRSFSGCVIVTPSPDYITDLRGQRRIKPGNIKHVQVQNHHDKETMMPS